MRISIVYFLIIGGLGIMDPTSQISHADLQKLAGDWEGTLTYTDFSDDISQSTLGCLMTASWNGNTGVIKVGFTEPNGQIIYDKTKIKLTNGGREIKFDGEKYLVDSFKNDESGNWSLVMSCISRDNNRQATIRQIIKYESTTLTLIKKVRYDDSIEFFIRNRYDFKR